MAILGSATSTSLTSRGRSMITDLPMPSDKKAYLDRSAGGNRGRAGIGIGRDDRRAAGLSVSAATAENDRARTLNSPHRRLISPHFISGVLSITSVSSIELATP